MLSIEIKHIFDLSADQLWELIGDFSNPTIWSGNANDAYVFSGEGVGALRAVTQGNGHLIVERLEAVGERSLHYSIVSSSLPILACQATLAAVPIAHNRSKLMWSCEYQSTGIESEQVISFFYTTYRSTIAAITDYIATFEQLRLPKSES